jgi:hypothetical protein
VARRTRERIALHNPGFVGNWLCGSAEEGSEAR